MKNLVFILIFLFVGTACATEVFKIDGVKVNFTTDKKKRITANEVCKKQPPCEALKVLRKLSKGALIAKDLTGGANPGPLLCEQQAKGTVVMGEDDKGNQNSFCKFKDGSIIDNGTLTYYGIINDRKK